LAKVLLYKEVPPWRLGTPPKPGRLFFSFFTIYPVS
jgi:hypothetical protein